MPTPKITPFLWFTENAEEAARFYVSLFPNSRMLNPAEPTPKGAPAAMVVVFEISGQRIMALNGGPSHKLNPAISLFVDCVDQSEVDQYWQKLTVDGGAESNCGWLTDKFGLSWQISPEALPKYLGGPDRAGAQRAMEAMLKMTKIDAATLERAYKGD